MKSFSFFGLFQAVFVIGVFISFELKIWNILSGCLLFFVLLIGNFFYYHSKVKNGEATVIDELKKYCSTTLALFMLVFICQITGYPISRARIEPELAYSILFMYAICFSFLYIFFRFRVLQFFTKC